MIAGENKFEVILCTIHISCKFSSNHWKKIILEDICEVLATFTSQVMSNHTTKTTQASMKINSNVNLSESWHSEGS